MERSPAQKVPAPILALREKLEAYELDGYVIPRFDEHQGEYCAPHDNRLAYVTGFTGSAGVAIVMKDWAALFVDGRYQVQVREEVDLGTFSIEHFHHCPLATWLGKHIKNGQRIGFNPMLLPPNWDGDCAKALGAAGAAWIPVDRDLVDSIWEHQPARPLGRIRPFPVRYSGETSLDKRRRVAGRLKEMEADILIEAQPDNIAWLLNVRGRDVDFNPMPQSFLILDRDGDAELFIDTRKLPNDLSDFELSGVTVSDPHSFLSRILVASEGRAAAVDPAFAPSSAARAVEEARGQIRFAPSPITLIKMVKNDTELSGFRECHRHDGAAWIKFLAWLDEEAPQRERSGNPVTEREAEDRILAFRREHPLFMEPSFRTISAAGPHAAMCHYSATEATDAPIVAGHVYLLDSGGQYWTGTTDATRTTAIGSAGAEIQHIYTAVLKGLISLLSLSFPPGTQGHHIDAFARRPLWDLGLDYDHGTGHGVGHCLSVHEQPQRFDKRFNAIDLVPGMVTTIEPGYYETGRYGIRLENQVEVVKRDNGFMGFDSLTLVPIDTRLVNAACLSESEKAWLNSYHQRILTEMEGLLDSKTQKWLSRRAAALSDCPP